MDEKEKPLTLDDWMQRTGGWTNLVRAYGRLGGDIAELPTPVLKFVLEQLIKENK